MVTRIVDRSHCADKQALMITGVGERVMAHTPQLKIATLGGSPIRSKKTIGATISNMPTTNKAIATIYIIAPFFYARIRWNNHTTYLCPGSSLAIQMNSYRSSNLCFRSRLISRSRSYKAKATSFS